MIVCAALKVRRVGETESFCIGGVRHSDCYKTLRMLGISDEEIIIEMEGFLTHKNNFLSRTAALCYAYEFGGVSPTLIKQKADSGECQLFSSDIW